jgi:transcriptional regulator with PAS, ATPase and Fis domain
VIVGVSSAIRRAVALAERYAPTRLAVLLMGATGTGKELFAQHIHRLSGRQGLLVDLNCCALPRDMVESLLFGHKRGAFTGAVESEIGHVERSHGGTLFLDELEGVLPEVQGKLLRVLETGEVQPLGSGMKRHVDLRVVGAVQDDISAALATGRFRRDLYQRVAGVVIALPTLAARLEDVVPLAEHFAALDGRRLEHGVDRVLLNYSWPGNVRELRLAIERAGGLVDNGTLPPTVVAEAIALGGPATLGVASAVDGRAAFMRTCEVHGWNGARIARALGISRTTLYRRLREVGLSLRRAKKYHFVPRSAEQGEPSEQAGRRDRM